jgi:hypothetical protein
MPERLDDRLAFDLREGRRGGEHKVVVGIEGRFVLRLLEIEVLYRTPTATSIFDMRATTQYGPPAYLVYPQEAMYVTSLPDQWGRIYHSPL